MPLGPFPFKHQNAGLTGIQNARITVLWRLPYRFQRKAYEARKYVSGSELLKEVFPRVRHKVARQKLKMQWRDPIRVGRSVTWSICFGKFQATNDSSPGEACEPSGAT